MVNNDTNINKTYSYPSPQIKYQCPHDRFLSLNTRIMLITSATVISWNKGYQINRKSASYLDHSRRNWQEGPIKFLTLPQRDDFNFPIVNFLTICSNILSAPVYGVYSRILQLVRLSIACDSCQHVFDEVCCYKEATESWTLVDHFGRLVMELWTWITRLIPLTCGTGTASLSGLSDLLGF